MSTLLPSILEADKKKLPKHIAIIMDGNGRWAKHQGKERVYGHQQAVHAVRSVIEGVGEAGIEYLTLYAFSTENWNRPKEEVDALISLLVTTINLELDNLMKNQVRMKAIGNLESLPKDSQDHINKMIEKTAFNKGVTVTLALSYSGRWEITDMVKQVAEKVKKEELSVEEITEETVLQNLSTPNYPDPDILIRTGGDLRISNFLLWQIAYTELFFTSIMWPDFRKEDLWNIISDFMLRQRRFGKTGEQVQTH